ncbi:hypothetical protein BK128_04680 [Viridibacillus sp. FSL H7-0596]|uniref:tyrosine-type recombinase/integrase n=1 Tax=Viridibacillus sp. FSL H7-0596 TaxID=1928923 RepID=UPI00096D2268|nr:tyrosine-type recombinase/integrase [Viridibacillus sp. FSL H7-0596]OMC89222.1 hypothetical protein BK128_04680 [Viridibacillus sp. FSL H7-0596]
MPMSIDIILTKYNEQLAIRNLSKETIRGYNADIDLFVNWITNKRNGPVVMESITRDEVHVYLASKKDDWAPVTMNRKIVSISLLFEYAYKNHYVPRNVMEDYPHVKVLEKERDSLTADEIKDILDKIMHPTIKVFAELLAHTGLRISEGIHLTLNDIKFNEGVLQVVNGKGGKDRTIPMSDALMSKLQYYIRNIRPKTKSNYFFALKKTGSLSQQYVNASIRKAANEAGINKKVTAHVFRHALASNLINNNVNVTVVQKILGHASLRTTQIYVHTDQDSMKQAVNTLQY